MLTLYEEVRERRYRSSPDRRALANVRGNRSPRRGPRGMQTMQRRAIQPPPWEYEPNSQSTVPMDDTPDVTGVLVLLLVGLGLFVLPLATTLAHGPEILSGFLAAF